MEKGFLGYGLDKGFRMAGWLVVRWLVGQFGLGFWVLSWVRDGAQVGHSTSGLRAKLFGLQSSPKLIQVFTASYIA